MTNWTKSHMLALLVLTQACAAGAHAPEDPARDFVEAYRAAHEAQDVEAAMKLVHWEGVTDDIRVGVRRTFARDFERGLERAELVESAEQQPETLTRNGVTYRAALRPVKTLMVRFTSEPSPDGEIRERRRPVGMHDGRYYFAVTVVKRPGGSR